MDEAVEIIITGTKLQNIQTILSFIISGTNSFFFYFVPFLFKNPSINNNYVINKNETKLNYSLEELCSSNDIYKYIDKNSIKNY